MFFDSATQMGSVGKLVELHDGNLLFMDNSGLMRVYQTRKEDIMRDLKEWRSLSGALDPGVLSIIYNGKYPDKLTDSNQSKNEDSVGEGEIGASDGQDGAGDKPEDAEGFSGSGGGKGYADGIPNEARKTGTIDSKFELVF